MNGSGPALVCRDRGSAPGLSIFVHIICSEHNDISKNRKKTSEMMDKFGFDKGPGAAEVRCARLEPVYPVC